MEETAEVNPFVVPTFDDARGSPTASLRLVRPFRELVGSAYARSAVSKLDGGVRFDAAALNQRRGNSDFRIFATTVKFGSTTFAISYSSAWPMNVEAPRSENP